MTYRIQVCRQLEDNEDTNVPLHKSDRKCTYSSLFVTKRMRSQSQASEMRFLYREDWLSL